MFKLPEAICRISIETGQNEIHCLWRGWKIHKSQLVWLNSQGPYAHGNFTGVYTVFCQECYAYSRGYENGDLDGFGLQKMGIRILEISWTSMNHVNLVYQPMEDALRARGTGAQQVDELRAQLRDAEVWVLPIPRDWTTSRVPRLMASWEYVWSIFWGFKAGLCVSQYFFCASSSKVWATEQLKSSWLLTHIKPWFGWLSIKQ
jgi:hypothetical protein